MGSGPSPRSATEPLSYLEFLYCVSDRWSKGTKTLVTSRVPLSLLGWQLVLKNYTPFLLVSGPFTSLLIEHFDL